MARYFGLFNKYVLLVMVVVVHSNPFYKDVPEEHMAVPEMIKYHGYPCEEHNVTTEDGYILSLHRIPHGRNGLKSGVAGGVPVFLQHGFIDSSATWTMNPPSQSLAFILADNGYDVWLGNSRGNQYSNKHIKYTTDDDKYWDFSQTEKAGFLECEKIDKFYPIQGLPNFDEMAKYDLPACINYILHTTRFLQLHYIGHSQGTTIGFICFSQNKEIAAKVKMFFALAPVATVKHVKGAVGVLSKFEPIVEELLKSLGIHEFLPSNKFLDFLAEYICGSSRATEVVCGNFIFLLAGFDTSNLNDTRIPVYLSHLPAGTSVKDFIHFLQMSRSGKFVMYDYESPEKNRQKYNQDFPPLYNISECSLPVAIFSGSQDWLADPEDVNTSILPYLPNIAFRKNLDGWNHLDFVWGIHANDVVYTDILSEMKKKDLIYRYVPN